MGRKGRTLPPPSACDQNGGRKAVYVMYSMTDRRRDHHSFVRLRRGGSLTEYLSP